jgi:putative sugar-binding protein
MSKLLLRRIADDFTGATDLANSLVSEGMRTIQTIGVPSQGLGTAVDATIALGRLPFATGEALNVGGGLHLHRV